MATREPVTINLGGQSYKIRPLTFSQIEQIEGALQAKFPAVKTGIAVLAVAMSRDHGGVSVHDIEGSANEIAEAMRVIINTAFEPGEATAAAKSASTGATSEGASSQEPA